MSDRESSFAEELRKSVKKSEEEGIRLARENYPKVKEALVLIAKAGLSWCDLDTALRGHRGSWAEYKRLLSEDGLTIMPDSGRVIVSWRGKS